MSDRWEGHTHQEIYEAVHRGPGRGVSVAAEAAWADTEALILRIEERLVRALEQSDAKWEGTAADAVRYGMTPLGSWALDAAGDARLTALGVTSQAEQAQWLRNSMPSPPGSLWNELMSSGGINPVTLLSDLYAIEEKAAADHAQAVHLMNSYSANSGMNTQKMDSWTFPPQVTVEVASVVPSQGTAPISGGAGSPETPSGDSVGVGPAGGSQPGGAVPPGAAPPVAVPPVAVPPGAVPPGAVPPGGAPPGVPGPGGAPPGAAAPGGAPPGAPSPGAVPPAAAPGLPPVPGGAGAPTPGPAGPSGDRVGTDRPGGGATPGGVGTSPARVPGGVPGGMAPGKPGNPSGAPDGGGSRTQPDSTPNGVRPTAPGPPPRRVPTPGWRDVVDAGRTPGFPGTTPPLRTPGPERPGSAVFPSEPPPRGGLRPDAGAAAPRSVLGAPGTGERLPAPPGEPGTRSSAARPSTSAHSGFYPPPMMGAGSGVQGQEHRRPSYLVDDSDAFVDKRWFTPAVIRADDPLPGSR